MNLATVVRICALVPLLAGSSSALRIYFIGNSLTDCVRYGGFQKMAQSRGYQQPWGRHMIPGANPTWIWQHPGDGIGESPYGLYPNALSNYVWDVMTLQPTDNLQLDSSACNKFINLARQKSPNIQVYIFAQHPYLERLDCLANPADGQDYDKHWLTPLSVFKQRCGGYGKGTKEYQDTLTLAIQKQHPELAKKVLLIPSGNALYELNQWMKSTSYADHATLAALGFTNVNQLYADAAHLNGTGCYVEACAFFATIYKEDPLGLPVPADYGTIDPRMAAIIQKAVWKVVTSHPLSGVTARTGASETKGQGSAQREARFRACLSVLRSPGKPGGPAGLLTVDGRSAPYQASREGVPAVPLVATPK